MPDPAAPNPHPGPRPEEPSFLMVVVYSAIAAVVFLIAAWVVVAHSASRMMPSGQYNGDPSASLVLPGPGAVAS